MFFFSLSLFREEEEEEVDNSNDLTQIKAHPLDSPPLCVFPVSTTLTQSSLSPSPSLHIIILSPGRFTDWKDGDKVHPQCVGDVMDGIYIVEIRLTTVDCSVASCHVSCVRCFFSDGSGCLGAVEGSGHDHMIRTGQCQE